MDWISLLPPSWQGPVHGLFTASATLAVALIALKPLLGEPSATDPAWKRLAFEIMHLADFIALNSKPVASPTEIAQLKASIPPPAIEPPAGEL